MTNILNRLRDLAVQGANGVYDENSLDAMQNEADSLVAQLKQIQQGTLFNGKSIFNTNATWSLTTQNAGTAAISTLSGGGWVSAKTPDTNSLAGINTQNSTPDTKSSSGFIQQINRLSEDEAIAQGYTVIKTAQDLDNIRNDLDGKYILMNDIDLSSYSNWDPIGDVDSGVLFTGTLDGNGYVISNLTINRPDEDAVGLFLGIGDVNGVAVAEIKNLGLENVDVTGGTNTGGLVGQVMDAELTNIYVTGNINGLDSGSDFPRVGGLIGATGGDVTLSKCYASCNLSGVNVVGGLVGCAYMGNLDISNSFVSGEFEGEAVGGILGGGYIGSFSINNTFSLATIKCTSTPGYAGGILYDSSMGTVSHCYVMGKINGNSTEIGAISGIHSAGQISDCLWNTETTGQSLAVGNNQGGTESNNKGLTTTEMQNPANWQGWDTNIWDFSTYPPTFKMYTPTGGGSTGGGTGGTDPSDPSNPDNPNTPGGGDVPIPGAVRLQIGSDSSSTSAIYVDTSFDLGAFDVDFSSADSCAAAIEDIDEVLSRINTKRSEFGAVINRLSSILESQTTTIQNFTSAKSTIMDADIANESADFVKNQILQQTSSALLAQSQNLHSSIVLSLIG